MRAARHYSIHPPPPGKPLRLSAIILSNDVSMRVGLATPTDKGFSFAFLAVLIHTIDPLDES
jgi:hypothetical protein